MPGYISSNENRFYVCAEPQFGAAAAITSANRIPAVRLKTSRVRDGGDRKDKTGTRTFAGLPTAGRYRNRYELTTYMTAWAGTAEGPAYGPLFEAAMGGAGESFAGSDAASISGSTVTFSGEHGLTPGQAIACGGEIRFVAGVADAASVVLNAPFSSAGGALTPTMTYRPATELRSFGLYDYWSPGTAVHRMLSGSGVGQMKIDVNGDFQQFAFSGECADLVDSSSFMSGQAGMEQFPEEPADSGFDHTIVPGHLGQAWLGTAPDQFFTLTAAEIVLDNGLELRAREFGSSIARSLSGGIRHVTATFSLFAQDETATAALYQAARQRSPVSVMLQLGEQQGQLCGIWMPSVILETPEFDDSETRLQWTFKKCRAQGAGNDEIVVAFG